MRRRLFGDEMAASEFVLVPRRGDKRRTRLRVGKPYKAPTGEWACPVEFRGAESRYPDIRGETSLQALCLAISFLQSRVEDVIAKGAKLLYVEDGEEWDKRTRAATFGGLGRRAPHNQALQRTIGLPRSARAAARR